MASVVCDQGGPSLAQPCSSVSVCSLFADPVFLCLFMTHDS